MRIVGWSLFGAMLLTAFGLAHLEIEEASAALGSETIRIEVDDELLARGEALYGRNCAPCHGDGGRGDGPSAEHLVRRPRDHTWREYMDGLSDLRIGDTIQRGGAPFGYPQMPSSPHLRGEDLAAVVAYLRTLSRGEDGVEVVELRGGE